MNVDDYRNYYYEKMEIEDVDGNDKGVIKIDDYREEVKNRWESRKSKMEKAGFIHTKTNKDAPVQWENRQQFILRHMSNDAFNIWFKSVLARKRDENGS